MSRARMSPTEAALYLGMTEVSFGGLVRAGLLPERATYSEDDLIDFRDRFLPRFKVWTSRTSLLHELFPAIEGRTGVTITPEPCEVEGCPNFAESVCSNRDCREDEGPRRICVTHREHSSRPSGVLCSYCVRRWLSGEFPRFRLARTRESLARTYADHAQAR